MPHTSWVFWDHLGRVDVVYAMERGRLIQRRSASVGFKRWIFFGLFMASYYAYGKRRYSLNRWEDF
jgi:hypothetical protein